MEKKIPARQLPCSWRRLGVLSWQGRHWHWALAASWQPVRSRAVTPALPQVLPKPSEPGPAWQQVFGFYMAALQEVSAQKLSALLPQENSSRDPGWALTVAFGGRVKPRGRCRCGPAPLDTSA